jgi:uncharacterized protein DUF6084
MPTAGGVHAGTIPQLGFAVLGAAPVEHAAAPTLGFALAIDSGGVTVRSVLLDVQVRIAARRRAYDAAEQERLFELFGAPADWGTALRTLLWTRATLVVPPFTGRTETQLPVACSYDLEVAGARYFDALGDGDVPLEFLFSGSVFYTAPDGRLQTARISWEGEAEYALPVAVWRETMERHFRGATWLRLQRDSFERLRAYRARHALPTWEATLDALLGEDD